MSGTTDSAERQWTILVYMAGDNNLSDRCVDDLREMKMSGLDGEANVKVQVDRSSAFGNRGERYTIKGCPLEGPKDSAGALRHDRDKWKGPFNSGRMKPLMNFIKWGIKGHENDRLMLILWGHASPADNLPIPVGRRRRHHGRGHRDLKDSADARSFFRLCADDYTKDGLSDIELKSVLRRIVKKIGRPIDILGFDACLLSMVELAYEMRESVNFVVASESLIPATSWPYHWILGSLKKTPEMTPKELCRTIVQKYITYYADYDDVPVQLSACDLSRCDHLAKAVGALAEKLNKAVTDKDSELINAVLSAHFRAQSYYLENYYDLYDFCYMLKDSCGNSFDDVQTACVAVMNELRDFVVASAYHNYKDSETDLQFSYGTSIYFPWTDVSPRYNSVEFAYLTRWRDFLDAYTHEIKKYERRDREKLQALALKQNPKGENDMVKTSTTKVNGENVDPKPKKGGTKKLSSATSKKANASTKGGKKAGKRVK